MNKTYLLPSITLACVFVWAGCNKASKLNAPSNFQTPAGAVELKLKWTPKERVVENMEMRMKFEMNMPGQSAPMKQDMTMGQKFALSVMAEQPSGGHEIELEFLRTHVAVMMGGKTMMEYDSAKSSTDKKFEPVGRVLGKMVGAKIQYFLDASNNVERIEGVDALSKKVLAGADPGMATSLKSMLNEGYLKQMTSFNRCLPPKAVQPGDTWPVQMDYPAPGLGDLTLNFTFTLKGWEMHGKRNCARLEFQGTITSKPSDEPGPNGMKMSIQDGSFTGASWFDPELGIVIDSAMNQDMKIIMSFGGQEPMTNQMNQILNIKLDSVE